MRASVSCKNERRFAKRQSTFILRINLEASSWFSACFYFLTLARSTQSVALAMPWPCPDSFFLVKCYWKKILSVFIQQINKRIRFFGSMLCVFLNSLPLFFWRTDANLKFVKIGVNKLNEDIDDLRKLREKPWSRATSLAFNWCSKSCDI